MEFVSNMTLKAILDGEIKQIKPCSEAVLPEDGIDLHIIFVSFLLVKERIKHNKIPKAVEVFNADRVLDILDDQEQVNAILESGKLTKKDLDTLANAIKSLPEYKTNKAS